MALANANLVPKQITSSTPTMKHLRIHTLTLLQAAAISAIAVQGTPRCQTKTRERGRLSALHALQV